MPVLTLKLQSEPEEVIEGWHVADGHWDATNGIGVLLIMSPEMRAKLTQGLPGGPVQAFMITMHCMNVVLERQLRSLRQGAT